MTTDEKNKDEKKISSVFTPSLPPVLEQFNISLAVSTYQAGKLILIRNGENGINTHFRNFNRPMGIGVKPNRISIGCFNTIENYQNIPAMIEMLNDSEKCDACYTPRFSQTTGEIDIHEMAWGANNQLWFLNTRFSCLCILDREYSFRPVWRPHFISGLQPNDRCHLNGLGMINGRPGYVTALGETDSKGGWRENKNDGGILMDVEKNEILLKGLSMPHSPRWYANQLWFLESGHGSIVRINPKTLEKHVVAKMPGFTRGLDFIGPLAFIGLSQVRETAVFSDFPLLEEIYERICGVWVVDIRTGKHVGFIKFDEGVQEIFSVQILRNTVFPEMLEHGDKLINACYVIPDEALKDVSKAGI